ncbi:tyrosine-type recombinase/integrase [Desulfurivibrio alkaliphilus]|uniref:Integrase family protein n=1 Tax=Desulfurivibrio alkaliphilus (strain DSM 19089 / UNIQEM U267 / AHT2) TaxID=589865 RepID=D6Z5H9_DESAT|nr:integrase arm-type DNA-binding domain-containing protein [Desulfurivibrio alkaliphilus]ADH86716.1 integrase family protein [Desulfurivibrio alkaliphilus AHT 2]
MTLTDAQVRNVKAEDKTRRLFDGGGLYLEVAPSGGKWWRFKYRFPGQGKIQEKRLSLGTYPGVGLKEARAKRDEMRRQIAQGIDPANLRRSTRGSGALAGSFEAVARLWHRNNSTDWAPSHSTRLIRRLEAHVFPYLGNRPVGDITAPDLMNVLERIKNSGHTETARRIQTICGQVFRYAVQKGFAEYDPSSALKGCLGKTTAKNMATITEPAEVGRLLQAIDEYPGTQVVRCALQLAPLFFVRSGELRNARWDEFDLVNREWKIPVERMKMRQDEKRARQGQVGHIVPLATQAVKILEEELRPLTGRCALVFPGLRSRDRAISDATLTNALRRMGYTGDEMTIHGLRHMASTLLHGLGFQSLVIERQLAHKDRNRIRGVYNQADYLEERRRMMQSWADYLGQLKAGKAEKVVPINRLAG